jgi:hypothetical protein
MLVLSFLLIFFILDASVPTELTTNGIHIDGQLYTISFIKVGYKFLTSWVVRKLLKPTS